MSWWWRRNGVVSGAQGAAPGHIVAGGGAGSDGQAFRMTTLSVLVLSFGVLSVGLTVAVAYRVFPGFAWIFTLTMIKVRSPAATVVRRVHADARLLLWQVQNVPRPPCRTVIPLGRLSCTVVGCDVPPVPVLVTHIA